MTPSEPRIISTSELSNSDARWAYTNPVKRKPTPKTRWITLKKIKYVDQDGKDRLWEYAERTTRPSSGVDAVAVLAIIKSKTGAFPPSTVVIEQYRPPIGKYVIEAPAGLVDEGETPEQAAIRELEEETGYKSSMVFQVTPVIVSDPGMTNANMQFVVLSVELEDKMEYPVPKLDVGEHIVTKVVPLTRLYSELEEYDKKGFIVDARLSALALGLALTQRIDT